MNYSFQYIDIILLAMIAGFIYLRLRGIFGRRSGFEGKSPAQFKGVLKILKLNKQENQKKILMRRLKKNFLKAQKLPMKQLLLILATTITKLQMPNLC